jgi:predicted nucleotidyltransferase/DNA-binding XRE family transcriptional regulator
MNLSRAIRIARTRAGLSQAALAARAKTSQPAIARYEAGAATPSIPTLERILEASGGSVTLGKGRESTKSATKTIGGRLASIRRQRDHLQEIARRHGVRNLRVFGSVARAEDSPKSDVDFLVDLEPGRTLIDLIGFQQEVQEKLGVDVDAATVDLLKDRVRKRAVREARRV